MHNEGLREIYYYRHADQDEPTAVIQLEDDEAQQLGAVIGGAYDRPKIVEDLGWPSRSSLSSGSRFPTRAPRSARRSRSAASGSAPASRSSPSCVAEPVAGAQPGDVIEKGDTLVTVGKLGQYREFRKLLAEGPFDAEHSSSGE